MDAVARKQARFYSMVAIAFLPAIGLYWFANNSARSTAIAQREQELLQFVHVSAVEYQSLLDETEGLLQSLIEFPEIRAGGDECSRRLAAVLRHFPQYTTSTLMGLDGYVTCGALTSDPELYLGDRAYFRLAMATNRFSVGDYAVGRITGLPTVGLAVPIPSEDGLGIDAVLGIALDLTRLGNAASRMNIPDGATFTVLDQSGTVMVRVPEGVAEAGADTVGADASSAFPELPQGALDPYLDTAIDLDGVERRFAIAPLRGGGSRANGYLIVGVETEALSRVSDELALRQIQFLATAGLAVLLLAWIFGQNAFVELKEEATA